MVGRPLKCSHKLHVKDWLQLATVRKPKDNAARFPYCWLGHMPLRSCRLCSDTHSGKTAKQSLSAVLLTYVAYQVPSAGCLLTYGQALDKDSIFDLSACLHCISVMLTLVRYYPRMIKC